MKNEMPTIILIAILVLINVVLIISELLRRKYNKEQLEILKQKKLEKGIAESVIDEEDLKDEIEPQQRYTWILGIVVCLDIWIIGAILTHCWAEKFFTEVGERDSRKALFGDSFGAVNALVSAFAFSGMIVAFVLQRYELRLQRKELQDNRAEMEQQTSQFKAQNKNLEIQRFENLFYNMLNLQQTIVDGIRYEYYEEEHVTVALDGGGTVTDKKDIKREVVGREVFRFLFEFVNIGVKGVQGHNSVNGYRWFLHYKGLKDYDTTLVPTYFDHYFRHLYKIIQFVDFQEMEFDEKYKYVSFLRGTLSRYELVWLYYNTLYPDFYKFKVLIERYSLLKGLRSDLLALSKETDAYYSGLGVKREELEAQDYNVGDFEFFLTDIEDEDGKYHISAFWNKNDIQGGGVHLANWRAFIEEKAKSVIQNV